MVQPNSSKFDRVSASTAGRLLLTSLASNVPGLKITTKRKKRMSKSADHTSTQPPAYERIKAQLERWKKQQELQQPQPDQLERNHDIRGGGEKAATVEATIERLHRKLRVALAAENDEKRENEERRRREKEKRRRE